MKTAMIRACELFSPVVAHLKSFVAVHFYGTVFATSPRLPVHLMMGQAAQPELTVPAFAGYQVAEKRTLGD